MPPASGVGGGVGGVATREELRPLSADARDDEERRKSIDFVNDEDLGALLWREFNGGWSGSGRRAVDEDHEESVAGRVHVAPKSIDDE